MKITDFFGNYLSIGNKVKNIITNTFGIIERFENKIPIVKYDDKNLTTVECPTMIKRLTDV